MNIDFSHKLKRTLLVIYLLGAQAFVPPVKLFVSSVLYLGFSTSSHFRECSPPMIHQLFELNVSIGENNPKRFSTVES